MTVLFFNCTNEGQIVFADTGPRIWKNGSLVGHHFLDIIPFRDDNKGENFFSAARKATPHNPTSAWELIVGTPSDYSVVSLRGYTQNNHIFIFGCSQEELHMMQREMDELTSELAQAHRKLHRQNLVLSQALYDQRQLVHTLLRLTAPTTPIWNVAMILPMLPKVIHEEFFIETLRQIWYRTGEIESKHILLDMSSVVQINLDVIKQLRGMCQFLQNLNVQPMIIEGGSELKEALVQYRIELPNIILHRDVREAIMYLGDDED